MFLVSPKAKLAPWVGAIRTQSGFNSKKKKKEHSDSQSCLDRMDSSKDSKFAGTGSEHEGARRPLGKCAQKEIYTELDRRKLALTSKSEKNI